ncbi:MAG TPA: VWA domain-containing protein [Spirochaetota bacterium]|nr:VWA domain-containing protein [Spirochaetota bacterium]
MKKISGIILGLAFLGLTSAPVYAQESPTQIVLILDASGSMWGKAGNTTKIATAKETLLSLVKDLADRPVLIALRIYGHRNRKCSNTVLEIPMGPVNVDKVRSIIMPLKPKGKTPISSSLYMAADDFLKDKPGEKIIIIITDGIETCGGDPCAVALKHQSEGIVTRVHLVGFGMKESELSTLKCVVKPSGGLLLSASNKDELNTALQGIVATSLRKNLVLTGTDKSGKGVFIRVIVSQQGQEKTRSEGNDVGFYLKPGSYDVAVTDPLSGKEVILNDVSVDDNHVERRKVFFGDVELTITGRDTSGNVIDTLVVIHDSQTGKIVKIFEKNSVHRVSLPVSRYDIELQDLETNRKEQIQGIELKENIAEEAIFKRGRLVVRTKNPKGLAIKTNVDIVPQGSADIFRSSPGKTVHEFILPEGTFSLTVKYWYSKAETTVPAVTIIDGETVEKDVVLETD